ncbi:hypothetical protein RBXJA2T_18166 [Rubrivivax benzoatilyticus JA2 = ATCC BAA-35]|nr:hypothetical protein RBXJA2T_18166 [Rubrivivax benzoatilyticus JA2 = ATCC BAA-35]
MRLLLLRAGWWLELTDADHEALTAVPDWHADGFRWIERWLAEHGDTPWPTLREQIAAEPWGEQAIELVDGAEIPIEPVLEDLRTAAAQTVRAQAMRQAMAVLGRR